MLGNCIQLDCGDNIPLPVLQCIRIEAFSSIGAIEQLQDIHKQYQGIEINIVKEVQFYQRKGISEKMNRIDKLIKSTIEYCYKVPEAILPEINNKVLIQASRNFPNQRHLKAIFQEIQKLTHLRKLELYFGDYPQNIREYMEMLDKKVDANASEINELAKVINKKGAGDIDKDIKYRMETQNYRSDCRISFMDEMLKQCAKIDEWKCSNLFFHGLTGQLLKQSYILKELSQIKFYQLKILSLFHCQIHTLEHLSRLLAPKLRSIIINNSVITSIRPLIKTMSSSVSNLTLQKNCAFEFNSLFETHWSKIERIVLELSKEISCQFQSLSILAKMNLNDKCKRLYCASSKRIVQAALYIKVEMKTKESISIISKE